MNPRRPRNNNVMDMVERREQRHEAIIKRERRLVGCALAICLTSVYFVFQSTMHALGWHPLFLGIVGVVSGVSMFVIRSRAAKDCRAWMRQRQDIYDLVHGDNLKDIARRW